MQDDENSLPHSMFTVYITTQNGYLETSSLTFSLSLATIKTLRDSNQDYFVSKQNKYIFIILFNTFHVSTSKQK